MPHTRLSSEEIARLGEELYNQRLRSQVETEENIGKLISIDVETGDYEIGNDADVDAPLRLHAKHPDAAVYTLRVGYDAAFAFGGAVRLAVQTQTLGAQIVAEWERAGVLGCRPDITDSQAHARMLRERAQKRERA